MLRAPENRRTGIEINPNVRYPDQTEAAIDVTICRDEARLVSDAENNRLKLALRAAVPPQPLKGHLIPKTFGIARDAASRVSTQDQNPPKRTEV